MAKTSQEYWADRAVSTQERLEKRNIREVERQLAKYYKQTMERVIEDFEATYDKVLATIEKGKEPTPADLYNLDRYHKMQARLRDEAQALGEKEVELLSKAFENHWKEVYESTALPSDSTFSTPSIDNARSFMNEIWCADGKDCYSRIWGNQSDLVQMLNDELVHCVVAGRETRQLRDSLMERFTVSRGRANTLIRTEMCHITTQATLARYADSGIERYEFIGREGDTCKHKPSCSDLNGKDFALTEQQVGVNCPPIHPNCRCCIAPMIEDIEDDEIEKVDMNKETIEKEKQTCLACGKQFVPRGGYNVCQACRNELLKDNEVLNYIARGYSKQDAVNYVSTNGAHVPFEKHMEAEERLLSNRVNLYAEYRKQNPRAKKLETMGYEPLGDGKWRKKFTEPKPKEPKWDWEKYPVLDSTSSEYKEFSKKHDEYIKKYNAWMDRKNKFEIETPIIDENDLFFKCVDCGKVFKRTSNHQFRCTECSKKHNKDNKAANARANRKKKKSK